MGRPSSKRTTSTYHLVILSPSEHYPSGMERKALEPQKMQLQSFALALEMLFSFFNDVILRFYSDQICIEGSTIMLTDNHVCVCDSVS